MNRHQIYVGLLTLILCAVLFSAFTKDNSQTPVNTHQCYDKTHITCDGYCECDGLGCPYEGAECPNAKVVMKDYQIELSNDFIIIYDGNRVVGTLKYETSLGKMVLRDNL